MKPKDSTTSPRSTLRVLLPDPLCQLVVLILFILPLTAHAQVNTESMRVAGDREGFNLQLDGSWLARGGNKDLNLLHLGTRTEYREGRHAAFLEGRFQFIEDEGRVLFNAGFAHLRYTLKSSFATWFSYEIFTQLDTDKSRFLSQRRLLGGGLRFRLYKTDPHQLYVGTNPMLEFERLDAVNVVPEVSERTVVRWSNFIVLQLQPSDRISIANTIYLQPRFDAFSDIRILEQASLNIMLTQHLSYTTTFGLRYDREPPGNLKSYDYTLTNGLSISW